MVALLPGLVLGAVVERVLIRPVENAPPLNAVILTLGLYTLLVAIAGMIWGNTPRSFPAAFSLRGYKVGGTTLLFTPNDTFIVLVVIAVAAALALLFRAHDARPADARVRRSRPRSRGCSASASGGCSRSAGRWRRWSDRSPACSSRRRCSSGPNSFDPILISGFVAAVLGGLDSPPGAVVGGLSSASRCPTCRATRARRWCRWRRW